MATSSDTTDVPWREQYPFASHWLPLAHGRLHYVDENRPAADEGGCLLFVHGNPTWSFHWREAIGQFRDSHRCVAIDHLGCGLSDKPQRGFRLADRIEHLVALIDALDLQHITLVAQDWGGAIGLGAMLQHREKLRRVVLLNTGAFPPPFVPRRIDVCRTPVLGKLALQGANLFSRAALRMTTRRSRLTPAISEGYLAPYNNWANRRAVYEFVADIPKSPRHPTWQTLAQIEAGLPTLAQIPSLLIWGMQDWCFKPECLQRFEQVWPEAGVLKIADAGHWVMEDATDQVLDAMAKFLQVETTAEAAT